MRKFYVTFSYGQPYLDYYYVLTAKDYEAAKLKVIKRFGNRWSTIFDSAEGAGIENFGLTRLHWYNLPLIHIK